VRQGALQLKRNSRVGQCIQYRHHLRQVQRLGLISLKAHLQASLHLFGHGIG